MSCIEPNSPEMFFWGKTDRNDEGISFHPLFYHLLDTAQVTKLIWNTVISSAVHKKLGECINVYNGRLEKFILLLSSLHDIGKASPAFQRKNDKLKMELETKGYHFSRVKFEKYHGLVSTWYLKEAFNRLLQFDSDLPIQRGLAVACGGHHGIWPGAGDLLDMSVEEVGDDVWSDSRNKIFKTLLTIFDCDQEKIEISIKSRKNLHTFCMITAGLISISDWIASMSDYFQFVSIGEPFEDYLVEREKKARIALNELGWQNWRSSSKILSAEELIGVSKLRPLQCASKEIETKMSQKPSIAIIEAPTGEGKTEAAWILADALITKQKQKGAYFAMPSQATSNQMFERVLRLLSKRYAAAKPDVHLIHGRAFFSEKYSKLKMAAINQESGDQLTAHSWFLPKKRGFLAPFAVGTVDQALLSILQTKHFFVRLYGLAHKTIIFDEIHAYDTYMNTLFLRLLEWLAHMGSNVIILSATLPPERRRSIVQAYTGMNKHLNLDYPGIIWTDGKKDVSNHFKAQKTRELLIEWQAPETYMQEVIHLYKKNYCIAIICNTVGKAQKTYEMLTANAEIAEKDISLFHARFPFYLRDQLEGNALCFFGKDRTKRPKRSILVATQIIEQSLDLDFDCMFTELAPVDLILQRAGRLQRHDFNRCIKPIVRILSPKIANKVPDFEKSEYVYSKYILLKTWLCLKKIRGIKVPTDVPKLIRQVYEDDLQADSPLRELLLDEKEKDCEKNRTAEREARSKLLLPPGDEDLFYGPDLVLDEDNPDIAQIMQAATRQIPPSVTLICLEVQCGAFVLPSNRQTVDMSRQPNLTMQKSILENAVNITHKPVVDYFREQLSPKVWEKVVSLSNCRIVGFVSGKFLDAPGYTIVLDRKLGLKIIRKEL